MEVIYLPTSWFQAIPTILNQVILSHPTSILDIGVGFGKYGLLLREVFEIPYERYDKSQWITKVDGVEVFETYCNPVYDFAYDNIYYGDIIEIVDTLDRYDVIMIIDVIEHFEKEVGIELINKLLEHTNRAIIVSTPIIPAPQESYLGNEHEHHKSIWLRSDFDTYKHIYNKVNVGLNGAHVFTLYPY